MTDGTGIYVKPKWDDYFFGIMDAVSKRATCDRGRSGCVIVKNNHILSCGYVGSPAGFPECDKVGHEFELRSKDYIKGTGNLDIRTFSEHCVRTIHAEMNAILHAAKYGISLQDSMLYCRMTPCRKCAEAIITVGITDVFCERCYQKAKESEDIFAFAGIHVYYKYKDEVQSYSK